jgi:hypothetical protein
MSRYAGVLDALDSVGYAATAVYWRNSYETGVGLDEGDPVVAKVLSAAGLCASTGPILEHRAIEALRVAHKEIPVKCRSVARAGRQQGTTPSKKGFRFSVEAAWRPLALRAGLARAPSE